MLCDIQNTLYLFRYRGMGKYHGGIKRGSRSKEADGEGCKLFMDVLVEVPENRDRNHSCSQLASPGTSFQAERFRGWAMCITS